MKATELMIGDWVAQKHSGLLLKVSEVRPPYIIADGEDGQFHEDTLEPILLTSEILAQNGFSKSRLMGEQRHFTYYLGPSLSMLAIYDADFSVHIGDGARYVKNIHQLQHILKDCGIDKEIIIKTKED